MNQGVEAALRRLVRVRWATRFTLAFGVAASGVANVLHAQDNPVSRAISAWPPVALLLSVELISRVPATKLWRAIVRLSATGVIASIAAWISYWHMAAVTARYGETGSGAWLLPLTVDGLVVVASISLVELTARIRDLEPSALVPALAKEGAAPQGHNALLNRAREVAAAHRTQTGRDITRDELRERLRIKTETATQLLQQIKAEDAEPVQAVRNAASRSLIGTVTR